ncbi:hypothetical protein GCM10017687_73320 [Streptomyces echinatus]
MRPTVVAASGEDRSPAADGAAAPAGVTPFLPVVFLPAALVALLVGGADEWCVAGMTAPVRFNVGVADGCGEVGPAEVLWCACGVCTGGAFPPDSGGQSGTLLTTHAYVYTQDRSLSPGARWPGVDAPSDTPGGYVPTDRAVTTTVGGDDEAYSSVRLTATRPEVGM